MFIRILFALLFVSQLSAQDKKFDIEYSIQKSRTLVLENPDSAKFYLDQIKDNLPHIKIKDSLLVEYLSNNGIYYTQISNSDSAKYFFSKALEKSTSNKKKGALYFNLANVYRIDAEYETSLKYLGMAIRLAEATNDKAGLALA